ncbi:MAG: pilin [Patescibacteria group bacterium]
MKIAETFNVGDIPNPSGYGGDPASFGSELLNNVISGITIIAGVLLFLYLTFGGFKYLTAGGDEKAVDEAKKVMTNAIVGLVIIVCAYFVTQIIGSILGFPNIFRLEFGGP